MSARDRILNIVLPIIGGAIGGTVGYFLFFWITRQGFYAMIAPGALLVLGCGLMARTRSMTRGIVCGVIALILGVYAEWKFAPFVDDSSFTYMATNIQKLKPITQGLIGIGGLIAFWLGKDGGYSGTYPKFGSTRS